MISFEKMSRKYISLSFLVLLLLCISCESEPLELRDDFRWIVGTWYGQNQGDKVVEVWNWKEPRYEGVAYNISNGDTVVVEELFIERFAGNTSYLAVVNSSGPYAFPLESKVDSVFKFVNADHDFPSTIIYRLDSAGYISISLMGQEPNTEEISYRLVRLNDKNGPSD